MQIPIAKPYFGPEEMASVQLPLTTGWVVQGPYVKEFEEKFSRFTGAQHSVATSSCTTALHIAVAALGLKPGDEVIVPGFTWVASANVVEYMGATPIFCDIDLTTFNIDTQQIESLITPHTVGIIPVHLFGLSADMSALRKIADKHNLWIVEDAACGFGAKYQGQHVGTLGEMGCFSFHPRKSITTGEGGMITTNSAEFDSISRSLRDHGASRNDLERHQGKASYLLSEYDRLGFNFRLTDIQGALGSTQMDRAGWILQQRHRIAYHYDHALSTLDWLDVPHTPEGYVHGYQSYVCLFRPEQPSKSNIERLYQQRNAVMAWMEEQGVATRQGTHAVIAQGYYVDKYGIDPLDFPNSYFADRLTLSLPLYPQMTEDEQEYVVSTLCNAIEATSQK